MATMQSGKKKLSHWDKRLRDANWLWLLVLMFAFVGISAITVALLAVYRDGINSETALMTMGICSGFTLTCLFTSKTIFVCMLCLKGAIRGRDLKAISKQEELLMAFTLRRAKKNTSTTKEDSSRG